MNKQRKVVITTTYNDLGVIIDTKAEELDSSTQPNLQLTCNQLATDTISRQAAIDAIRNKIKKAPTMAIRAMEVLKGLPSAQPEIIYCGECKHMMPNGKCRQFADSTIRPSASDFCSAGERKDNG